MSIQKLVFAAALVVSACSLIPAQMQMDHGSMQMGKDGKPVPSPRKTDSVSLSGTKVDISYGAPSLRGRKMIGEHDPYGKEWRLGANEATSFVTSGDVTVGGTAVPAGSYTLFALPTADKWTLIISKKTGEWGIPYPGQASDFARVEMKKGSQPKAQEQFSITFEKTSGPHTEMHVRWDKDDHYVVIAKK